MPFARAFLAKSFFNLESNEDLILRLQSDSSLKKIFGFTKVPNEATFSRHFDKLVRCHFMDNLWIGIDKRVIVTLNKEDWIKDYLKNP